MVDGAFSGGQGRREECLRAMRSNGTIVARAKNRRKHLCTDDGESQARDRRLREPQIFHRGCVSPSLVFFWPGMERWVMVLERRWVPARQEVRRSNRCQSETQTKASVRG